MSLCILLNKVLFWLPLGRALAIPFISVVTKRPNEADVLSSGPLHCARCQKENWVVIVLLAGRSWLLLFLGDIRNLIGWLCRCWQVVSDVAVHRLAIPSKH